MILTLLGTIFSSTLAGGATGLAGVGLQRFFDFLNRKADLQKTLADQAHQLKMREVDLSIMQQEWAGRLKVAEREGATAENVAATAAFKETLFTEPERYSDASRLTKNQMWWMVALDFIRGIIRPALTVYLCVLTTLVYVQARQLLSKEDLTVQEAMELTRTIVGTILYLTTTVTLWWFGTQNKQSQAKARGV